MRSVHSALGNRARKRYSRACSCTSGSLPIFGSVRRLFIHILPSEFQHVQILNRLSGCHWSKVLKLRGISSPLMRFEIASNALNASEEEGRGSPLPVAIMTASSSGITPIS